MYQVITMYGDNEPWWFFDEWQNDIVEERLFDNLEDAERYYVTKWQEFSSEYTYMNTKPNYLTAFWNNGDERWCEECDEDLQQYQGIALLQDYKKVAFENKNAFTTGTNHCEKVKTCTRKAIS